jgi:ribonuclease III
MNFAISEERRQQLASLEMIIGCTFKNLSILDEALIHKSFAFEGEARLHNNQKLEFLGDAVLGLAVTQLLMTSFPELDEGEMSRIRSAVVNEQTLADVAREIRLGEFLRLGKGEESSQGRSKDSILADCLEAVLGAIFWDAGFLVAYQVVEKYFLVMSGDVLARRRAVDYKSTLQQMLQQQLGLIPHYRLIGTEGPEHGRIYVMEIELNGTVIGRGRGTSKKMAEHDAARMAVAYLTASCDEQPADGESLT